MIVKLCYYYHICNEYILSHNRLKNFRIEEILAELQFSFVCFLVGQNYDSFERWKKLLEMILTCDEALNKYPQLYNTLITDMHFQVRRRF